MRRLMRLGATLTILVTAAMIASSLGAGAQDSPSPDASPSQEQEAVRFTWASTGEPSSLNPMSGYLALDFYFWTPSYHLLVDFDTDFGVEPADDPGAGL